MQRLSIFAGIGPDGALRFVGDVAPGAACNCRCVACGARLIAKRGEVKVWHFAHEANQERPDCYAGAVNLLRALAIERLRERSALRLPVYTARVRTRPPLPELHDRIEWEPGAATVLQWADRPHQASPVAMLELATGTRVVLFVAIDGARDLAALDQRDGAIVFDVSLPADAAPLRDLVQAKRYIDETGRFEWLALPDADGMKADMLEKLRRAAQTRRDAAAQQAAQRRPQASAAALPTALPQTDDSPWAAWRKQPSSFFYYQLKDDSRWVVLAHQDGRWILAPWPPADEGWDESMPPRHGAADHALGGLVLVDRYQTMDYLSARSRASTITSNWHEMVEFVRQRAGRGAGG